MANRDFINELKTDIPKFIDELKNADPTDDLTFASLVDRVVLSLGVDEDKCIDELADALLVSSDTVKRYRQGSNLPHVALRKTMYEIMAEKINEVWSVVIDGVEVK